MNLFFDFALGSFRPGFFPLLALQQITRLAVQSTAQFIQNIRPIHFRAIVAQPEQRGIANTRFLSQSIHGPPFVLKYLGKPTKNHSCNLAALTQICQSIFTCIVYFTQPRTGSRLASVLKGKADIDTAVNRSEVERHAT